MFYMDYVDGKKVVKSDLLDITHFFTTRDSCIFSKEEDLSAKKRRLAEVLGYKLITNLPVHGVNIEEVDGIQTLYKNTDGLVLRDKGVIYMSFGDCTPLILSCKNTVMISHAGWRGTAQNMATISFNKMVKEYGYNPKDIKVVIGPTVCKNCYEVDEEVYNSLYKTIENKGDCFCKDNGRYFVDLKEINKQQLIECGAELIDVCPYCTACGEGHKLFFSYRHDNHTGYRHSAVVKL